MCALAVERVGCLALGLAVGLARLDHARLQAGNFCKPLRQRGTHRFGLRETVAESLARALVEDHHRDGRERLAVLACERRIGERDDEQRQGKDAQRRAAAADEEQQCGKHDHRGPGRPHRLDGYERRK